MAGIADLLFEEAFEGNLVPPKNMYQPETVPTIQEILAAQEAGTYTPDMYDKYLANLPPYEKAEYIYNKSPRRDYRKEDYASFNDFLTELKTINRKKLTPDFINKEGLLGRKKYNKTPQGLFTDSYDETSNKNLTLKQLEREYSGFRDILNRIMYEDLDFDTLHFNKVLSPVAFDILDAIEVYREKHKSAPVNYIPETYEQLLTMKPPQGSS
tara:strand:- start:6 stop:641 length:636 start_codon:yes stop_codon:yes gene_type:complete